MSIQDTETGLRRRTVGEIAATMPGATAVFRKFKIDFCCNGDLDLAAAAQRRNIDPVEVERALDALTIDSKTTAALTAMDSDALIDHIQTRHRDAHGRTLPELIALSRRVEAVHREHPKVPAGLSDTLQQMQDELGQHMGREETTLFPVIRKQANGELGLTIGELRHEHDNLGVLLHQLEDLTDDFTLPEGACRSWQALYVGTAQLADDLMEQIHLENNVLFPRFAARSGEV